MTTIFNPDILQAKQYACSDAMKDVLYDYGSPVSALQDVVTAIGVMAQIGDGAALQKVLADTVRVRVGGDSKDVSAADALGHFRKLSSIPNIHKQLYDEGQMIFTSDAIGLFNGMVWIDINTTIEDEEFGLPEVMRVDLRVTTLNLET